MILNGVYYENSTCRRCRNRHPKEWTCELAKSVADHERVQRRLADHTEHFEPPARPEHKFRFRVGWRGRLILQRLTEIDGPSEDWRDVRVEELGGIGILDVTTVMRCPRGWAERGTPIYWPR